MSGLCSGLTDCFSVVGTLITAPTLSQASASLPPSFPLPAMRCSLLQACPALLRHGAGREGKDWKSHKDTRHQVRGRAPIWEYGRRNKQVCWSCQIQRAPGGKADLRSGSELAIIGQRSVCGRSSTQQGRHPRKRGSFYSDVLHSPVCSSEARGEVGA